MAQIDYFDVGDQVRATGKFTIQASGVLTDPDTVTVKYKNPAGTTTTKVHGVDNEVVKSAVGIYYIDIDANDKGRWQVRWISTGAGAAAEPDQFGVRPENL